MKANVLLSQPVFSNMTYFYNSTKCVYFIVVVEKKNKFMHVFMVYFLHSITKPVYLANTTRKHDQFAYLLNR